MWCVAEGVSVLACGWQVERCFLRLFKSQGLDVQLRYAAAENENAVLNTPVAVGSVGFRLHQCPTVGHSSTALNAHAAARSCSRCSPCYVADPRVVMTLGVARLKTTHIGWRPNVSGIHA